MSQNLSKVLDRVKDGAARTMEQGVPATRVLHNLVNQYAMPLLAFKQTGRPPDIESLETLATKLVAIVAATYDGLDAAKGKLP